MQTIEHTHHPANHLRDSHRDDPNQTRRVDRTLPAASLYFAYGSNLHLDQMAVRCPAAQPLGPLTLPGWRLEFRSVADIVPCVGAEVVGALYRIEAGDELALDRYEGFRRSAPGQGLYRKVTRWLQDQSGRVEPFMFYVMNAAGNDFWPPQPSYLHTIRQGYADWHLPTETLEDAVLRSKEAAARLQLLPGWAEINAEDMWGAERTFDDEERTFAEEMTGDEELTGSLFGEEW